MFLVVLGLLWPHIDLPEAWQVIAVALNRLLRLRQLCRRPCLRRPGERADRAPSRPATTKPPAAGE